MMEGIELAVRFAYIVNAKRLCGPDEAKKAFLEYLDNRENSVYVASLMKKFESLYPYLNAIAAKKECDFLEFPVVEAYWIGNPLLDKFKHEDLEEIIKQLGGRGLAKSIVEKRLENLRPGAIPHHNFHVFYVGAGLTAGTLIPTQDKDGNPVPKMEDMSKCMTYFVKVTEIGKDKLQIVRRFVEKTEERYFMGEEKP